MSALAGNAASAQTPNGALTGKVASFNYLLGAPWNCTTNVPAMNGQPAQVLKGSVTFDVAPGNVLHAHVGSGTFSSDQYFGYSTRQNTYWTSTANSVGMALFQTSTDGKTYVGSAAVGASPATIRDTYTKAGDNRVTVNEVTSANGSQEATDSVCTR